MAEQKRDKKVSRREFLKDAAVLSGAVVGGGILSGPASEALAESGVLTNAAPPVVVQAPGQAPTPYTANALMVVMHDPSRCIGCRRCEVACTLTHDNKIQPTLSRVKVSRNFNFGPEGPRSGFGESMGLFGNLRLIGDTCLQCAHPTPCLLSCPSSAIEVVPPVNARVINADKCTGCQTCGKACPWAMISFDKETKKSVKCDLCGGDPECVKVCPSGALSYVPWRDTSKDTPVRQAVPSYVSTPADVAASCVQCHPTAAKK